MENSDVKLVPDSGGNNLLPDAEIDTNFSGDPDWLNKVFETNKNDDHENQNLTSRINSKLLNLLRHFGELGRRHGINGYKSGSIENYSKAWAIRYYRLISSLIIGLEDSTQVGNNVKFDNTKDLENKYLRSLSHYNYYNNKKLKNPKDFYLLNGYLFLFFSIVMAVSEVLISYPLIGIAFGDNDNIDYRAIIISIGIASFGFYFKIIYDEYIDYSTEQPVSRYKEQFEVTNEDEVNTIRKSWVRRMWIKVGLGCLVATTLILFGLLRYNANEKSKSAQDNIVKIANSIKGTDGKPNQSAPEHEVNDESNLNSIKFLLFALLGVIPAILTGVFYSIFVKVLLNNLNFKRSIRDMQEKFKIFQDHQNEINKSVAQNKEFEKLRSTYFPMGDNAEFINEITDLLRETYYIAVEDANCEQGNLKLDILEIAERARKQFMIRKMISDIIK